MFYVRCFLIVLLLSFGVFLVCFIEGNKPKQHQDSTNVMFIKVDASACNLSDNQKLIIDKHTKQPYVKQFWLVKFNSECFKNKNIVLSNVTEFSSIVMSDVGSDQFDSQEGKFVWNKWNNGDDPKSVVFFYKNNSGYGTISSGILNYWIRPIGNGLNLIINYSNRNLPRVQG